MKKLATLLLSGFLALPLQAQDLTLDQLVEKNIEARGGRAAWEKTTTMRMTGNFQMGPGIEAPFTILFARPSKMRLDFEVQGIKASQAYDGEAGWSIMPFMGSPDPQKMTGDELKQVKRMAEFDGPLFDWKKKGYAVELVGKADVEGTPAYKLKVVRDGEESFLYVDADAFLEFREESTVTTQQGAEIKLVSTMGDYKEVGELIVAHSIQTRMEGSPQGQNVTMKTIELNADIKDDAFKMPPPAPKPAAAPEPKP